MSKRINCIVLALIVFLTFAATTMAAQFARPDGTVSAGGWTAAGVATLHEATDEVTPNDDTDYMTTGTNTTAEVSLSNVTDPQSSTGHIMRLRMMSSGGKSGEKCTFSLFQGATGIATLSNQQSRGSYTTFSYTLSAAEADAITDYSDLRFVIVATGVDSGDEMRVTWAELEVPDAAATAPTLLSPAVANIDTTSAGMGAMITDDGGDPNGSRGTVWNTTGSPITENPLQESATSAVGAFSHNRTGLPAGTLIYYRGYASNSGGTGYSPDDSFYTEPTQASNVTFSNVTSNSMTINWTPGGQGESLVVVRAGADITSDPADGTVYTANTTYGSGDPLGGGFVVYTGAGSSVGITSLNPSTTYFVRVYQYAGSGSLINYQQDTPATGNQTTQPPSGNEPTIQASNFRWDLRSVDGELTFSWTPGNGDGSIALIREGSPVDADPVDGITYAANTSTWNDGDEIATGNYVVYVGSGSQMTITGLASDLPYYAAVYAYNSGAGTDYRQTAPARGNSGHNAAHGLVNCSDCHFGTGNFHGSFAVPIGTTQGDKCKTCHNPTGQASGKSAVDLHKGTKYNTLVDCGSCHEVHNSFYFVTTDTHTGGVSATNIEWIRPDTTKYTNGALEPALFQANTGFFAWDDSSPPWNGICQTCHTQTDRHRNNNDPPNPHSHEVTNVCTTCHTHEGDAQTDQDGFMPQGGTCTGCHSKVQGARRQITESSAGAGDGEFATGFTSHHVNDGSGSEIVTKWDCVVCHAEGNVNTGAPDDTYHKKDGVQLKDVDTGAVFADWTTLTPAERSNFCLSCHDSDGATIITGRTDPDPDATTDPLNPYNDGLTNAHEPDGFDATPAPHSRSAVVDVASQFDPLNTSHHAVLGAAYASATPFGSGVDNAIQGVRTDLAWNSVIDCEDCHSGTATTMLSGHGTANARYMLRDKDGNDTLTTGANIICYRCHNPADTNSTYPEHDKGAHINDTLNIFGISCLNCHGGGEWGGVHGVDVPVTDDDGGGSYNPNVFTYGSGIDLISNWTSWSNKGVSCSSLANPTLLNDCTQHGSQAYTRGQSRTYRNP